MKARQLLSILAAIACPIAVQAQATDADPSPQQPKPPAQFDAPPPPPGNSAQPPKGDDPDNAQPGRNRHHHHGPFGRPQATSQQPGDASDGNAAAGPSADPRARMGHLREAVHQLRAAGMNEEADRVEQEARKMREEFGQKHREDGHDGPQASDGQSGNGPGPRGPNGGPRGEFGGHRPFPDMGAQIMRLSREMEEMRNELRAMREHRRDGRGGDDAQADGPRGQRPPFLRPEWRDHSGNDGMHQRGEHHDGVPPAGNRPPGPGPDHQDGGPKDGNAPPAPAPAPPAQS